MDRDQIEPQATLRLPSTVFLGICSAESLAALVWLAVLPVDPTNQVALGYSAARLAIMFACLLLAAGFALLAWLSHRRSGGKHQWTPKLLKYIPALSAASIPVILFAAAFIRFYRNGRFTAVYTRLEPLIFLVILICCQFLVWCFYQRRNRLHPQGIFILKTSAICLAALSAIWALIALSGLGVTPEPFDGWGKPGVPLLEGQLWLAGLAAALALLAFDQWPGLQKIRKLDLILFLFFWLGSAIIWLAEPVRESYFLLARNPPTFQFYPYSDAGYTGYVAEAINLGLGYLNGQITTRPFYVLLVAVFYAIAGQDYLHVIALQTLLLAAFPAIVYLLGTRLHSRPAGILAAILTTLREVNSIQSSPFSGVSNSKLFMSDLPTALGVALITFLAVTWLRDPPNKRLHPALLGGSLGLMMLIRAQAVMLAPFLLLASLPVFTRRLRPWLVSAGLLGIALLLTISPWLVRNTILTGKVIFDQSVESQLFARRFVEADSGVALYALPGEDEGEFSSRIMNAAVSSILKNPIPYLQTVGNHFLNNEIQSLLVLPVRRDVPNDLAEFFTVRNSFWLLWEGHLGPGQAGLVLINLALVSLGIGAACKRWRFIGFIPLWTNVAYSLSNAVARNSGWRYILPGDWVGYFYWSLGVIQLIGWALVIIPTGYKPSKDPLEQGSSQTGINTPSRPRSLLPGVILVLSFFLLAGSLLPLSELVVPRQYPVVERSVLAEELLTSKALLGSGINIDDAATLANDPGTFLQQGRIIYPNFYPAGEGEPGGSWAAYRAKPSSRLTFLFIGADKWDIIMPMDSPPAVFPHFAGASILGCPQPDGTVLPLLVVPDKPEIPILTAPGGFPSSCTMEAIP